MYDVELFQSNDMKIHLQNMLEKYGNLEELVENVDILNDIQELQMDNVLSNFMEFKYLLKTQQVITFIQSSLSGKCYQYECNYN